MHITEGWSEATYDALTKFNENLPLTKEEEVEVAYHYGSGNNR